MQYRNTKTGVIVEVFSEVSGDWEKVEEQPSPVSVETEEKPKKASRKKKEGK